MPTEIIRYQVTGQNPATGMIPITLDATGAGSVSIPVSSQKAGIDTIQAYMDSMNLTSNQAQVIWQSGNGVLAIENIQAYVQPGGNGTGYFPSGLTAANFGAPQSFNSLMFNTHPDNILAFFKSGSSGYNTKFPMLNQQITTQASWAGSGTDIAVTGTQAISNGHNPFNMVVTGNFVVPAAGAQVFTCYVNSSFLLGIGQSLSTTTPRGVPSYSAGTLITSGVNTTPFNSFQVLAGLNGPGPGYNFSNFTSGNTWATVTTTVSFSQPGVYPFELCYTGGIASERQLCLEANGGCIGPANYITGAPPAAAAAGSKLALTPNGGGPNLLGTTQNFVVTTQNIPFTSKPYLPLLEGVPATVYVCQPSGSFQYPTLPDNTTIDPNLALQAGALTIQGDNGSYQGKLGLSWNGTSYSLAYNGAAVDVNIPSTDITVQVADVAWYNSNIGFDLFTADAEIYGTTVPLQVNWLVSPVVSSYLPQITGDGNAHEVYFTLAKPMPPIQAATTTATATAGTGLTVQQVVNSVNSLGWILGFVVYVQTVSTTTQINSQITLTVTDTPTFLNGTTFSTGPYTYINAQVFPVVLGQGPTFDHVNAIGVSR